MPRRLGSAADYEALQEIAMRATRYEAEALRLRAASPDDIRGRGWDVAIHNDYRQGGRAWTFWLFTHCRENEFAKGEGQTDAQALNDVRSKIGLEVIE